MTTDIPTEDSITSMERESILNRIDSHLAAGLTLQRLALFCNLDRKILERAILENRAEFKPTDHWDSRATKDRAEHHAALKALSRWLTETGDPVDDIAGYAITPTFNHLQSMLANAHAGCRLLAITGTYGIGKTVAAKYYAATHARSATQPGAVYIQFAGTDASPVAMLTRILNAIDPAGHARRYGATFSAIGDALRPGDFLILDECQRLGGSLDQICSLWDDFGIGIAMMGNPDLSTSVWGKRSAFGALASRANRINIPHTTAEDVDAWLAWKGIPEGLGGAQRTAFVNACIEIATRPGANAGLRTLSDLFRNARDMYQNHLLTADVLRSIAAAWKPDPV